jgi:hypothetical protein
MTWGSRQVASFARATPPRAAPLSVADSNEAETVYVKVDGMLSASLHYRG